MFPPLPKPECEHDPLDERELREEAFQSVLDKNAEAYDLFTTQPIVIFWVLVSVAISVAGGIVGGVLYGSEGAVAGVAITMSAVFGLMPIVIVGAILGDAMSRTLAGAAGAAASLASVYRLGDMEPWLCQLAFLAGGVAALLAATLYREHLARAHGCPRLRFSIGGLVLRGVYVVVAAIAWANYSGGS